MASKVDTGRIFLLIPPSVAVNLFINSDFIYMIKNIIHLALFAGVVVVAVIAINTVKDNTPTAAAQEPMEGNTFVPLTPTNDAEQRPARRGLRGLFNEQHPKGEQTPQHSEKPQDKKHPAGAVKRFEHALVHFEKIIMRIETRIDMLAEKHKLDLTEATDHIGVAETSLESAADIIDTVKDQLETLRAQETRSPEDKEAVRTSLKEAHQHIKDARTSLKQAVDVIKTAVQEMKATNEATKETDTEAAE